MPEAYSDDVCTDQPVLLQILNGNTDPAPAGSIYSLPGNSTIEISMPGNFPHPMHLHGHNFDIVRSAGQDGYNYVNPPRRDVVSIGSNTTDNGEGFKPRILF